MFESRVCDSEPMLMFQDKTVVLHIHSHVGFGETDIWLRRHDLRSLEELSVGGEIDTDSAMRLRIWRM
jgi:hypothetical protein